jgi:seryl-tRNA synthetase
MATRRRTRPGRKTARRYNGGGRRSARVHPHSSPKINHGDIYPITHQFENAGFISEDERKTLQAHDKKRKDSRKKNDAAAKITKAIQTYVSQIKASDKEILAVSNKFITFADIYADKSVSPGFTADDEHNELNAQIEYSKKFRAHLENEFREHLKTINTAVNKRNQIIMDKLPDVGKDGTLNANETWSSSSSKKSKSQQSFLFFQLLYTILHPFSCMLDPNHGRI